MIVVVLLLMWFRFCLQKRSLVRFELQRSPFAWIRCDWFPQWRTVEARDAALSGSPDEDFSRCELGTSESELGQVTCVCCTEADWECRDSTLDRKDSECFHDWCCQDCSVPWRYCDLQRSDLKKKLKKTRLKKINIGADPFFNEFMFKYISSARVILKMVLGIQ